eukprot:295856_1
MPKGVQELAFSTINGTVMYLFGGYDGSASSGTTAVYKWNSNIENSNFTLLSTTAPMAFTVGGKSTTTINNRYIYIMGITKTNAYPKNYVWVFDTVLESFDSTSVTLPTGVLHTCSVTNDDNSKIYVLGGQTDHSPGIITDIVQVYNVNGNYWSNVQNMPIVAHAHGCVYFNESIYSFGANTQDTVGGTTYATKYILYYDVVSDSWQQLTEQLSVIYSRTTAMLLESYNLIIVLSNTGGICDIFNPTNNQIIGNTTFVYTRLYGAFGWINNELYAMVGTLYPWTPQAEWRKSSEKLVTTPTDVPTTVNPTTSVPTTQASTTSIPTTTAPTATNTSLPTTWNPTTFTPTTATPTATPITAIPTTSNPTTSTPTTTPITQNPTTFSPTTSIPTTSGPTTYSPTTVNPTTFSPTTSF